MDAHVAGCGRYSAKVVTVHPLSEMFLDKIDDARRNAEEERERLRATGEEPLQVLAVRVGDRE